MIDPRVLTEFEVEQLLASVSPAGLRHEVLGGVREIATFQATRLTKAGYLVIWAPVEP